MYDTTNWPDYYTGCVAIPIISGRQSIKDAVTGKLDDILTHLDKKYKKEGVERSVLPPRQEDVSDYTSSLINSIGIFRPHDSVPTKKNLPPAILYKSELGQIMFEVFPVTVLDIVNKDPQQTIDFEVKNG